jgi:hypothetical protein
MNNERLELELSNMVKHALGIKSQKEPFRRHYYASVNDRLCLALVAKGYFERGEISDSDPRYRFYYVTEAGAAAVGSHLPKDD